MRWNADHRACAAAVQPPLLRAGGLLTYAREWREAHGEQPAGDAASALPPYELESGNRLKLADLVNFLRQPVRYFFRQRLGVMFGDAALVGEDEEPFSLDALERYLLEDQLLADDGEDELPEQVAEQLTLRAARLAREGVLPIGLIGQQYQQQLVQALVPVRSAWLQLRQQYPLPAPRWR
jgi:exodeoxyribonuclease V gamma subunit